MRISDWSSDVCSSDLRHVRHRGTRQRIDGTFRPLCDRQRFEWWGKRTRGGGVDGWIRGADRDYWRSSNYCKNRRGGIRIVGSARADAHTAPRSEEHTSELQSLMRISYAVLCLNKKNEQVHNREI